MERARGGAAKTTALAWVSSSSAVCAPASAAIVMLTETVVSYAGGLSDVLEVSQMVIL